MDSLQRPVLIGVVGELVTTGEGFIRGYIAYQDVSYHDFTKGHVRCLKKKVSTA